jgi:uncharacterized protein with von Willebrand factor type A (vWA) domain
MSPYEIEQPDGNVEHWNEESGRVFALTLEGLDRAMRELKRGRAYTSPHVS